MSQVDGKIVRVTPAAAWTPTRAAC
jgi:hypothetical protein